jgi:hypothetical protein
MMVMGYWENCGYPSLLPGPNPSITVIDNLIASPEHNGDATGTNHVSNCLADFMYTSWSSKGNGYGETGVDQIAAGMARYATWRSSTYTFTANDIWVTQPQWTDFIKEIQYGRPVVLSVDSNGDGILDHSVAAIGYRTTNGYNEYLCHDTYGNEVWYRFSPIAAGTYNGVGSMATLRPAGTADVTWKGASGAAWATSTNWTGGVPTSSTFVWLPSTAQVTASASGAARMLQMQGKLNLQSRLDLGTLHILDGGSVTMTTGTPRLGISYGFDTDGVLTQSTGTVAASSDIDLGNATFTQSGGVVTVGGSLNVGTRASASGVYALSGGQLSITGGEAVGLASGIGSFTQSGGVHSVGGCLNVGSIAGSSGAYTLSAGQLSVTGSEAVGSASAVGSFTQSGGTQTVGGLLDIESNFQLTGGSLTAGQVSVGAGARLAVPPGPGSATTHLGSVTFAPTSTYVTCVSGTAAGSQYGQLSTTSGGSLNGATLDLGLLYDPRMGDRYTLLTSAGSTPVSGTFAGLAQGALLERQNATSLKTFLLQITYTGGAGGDVAVQDLAIAGDGNRDGAVDGADYGVWQNGYGKSNPTFWTGDYNLDGVVDGEDYGVWQTMYGLSNGIAAPVVMTPEPATMLMLGLGGLLLAIRRRRHAGIGPHIGH